MQFWRPENLIHVVSQQIWHIWEENTKGIGHLLTPTKCWVMLSLLVHQHLSGMSLCRFLWVCVSGLKTTSLLRLVNRRLNMPTSECAPVSPSLYQCQIFLQKNARFTCQKTTFHFAILYTCMCKTAAYGLEGRFTGLWKRSLRSSTSRAASQIV